MKIKERLKALEFKYVWLAMLAAFINACILSPWNEFFLGNMLPFFGPALVLFFLSFWMRPAIAAGGIAAFAIFALFFRALVFFDEGWGGLGWLIFVFSLPFGLCALILSAVVLSRTKITQNFKLFMLGFFPCLAAMMLFVFLWAVGF